MTVQNNTELPTKVCAICDDDVMTGGGFGRHKKAFTGLYCSVANILDLC